MVFMGAYWTEEYARLDALFGRDEYKVSWNEAYDWYVVGKIREKNITLASLILQNQHRYAKAQKLVQAASNDDDEEEKYSLPLALAHWGKGKLFYLKSRRDSDRSNGTFFFFSFASFMFFFFSTTQHTHTHTEKEDEDEDDRDVESRENLRSAVAEFENAQNVNESFTVMKSIKDGIIEFNNGDFQSAKAHFKNAIRENPTCPAGVRVALGHTFFQIGLRAGVHNAKHGEALIAKAEKCFIRALNLDPENVEAKAALGVLEDRKGNVRCVTYSHITNILKTHTKIGTKCSEPFSGCTQKRHERDRVRTSGESFLLQLERFQGRNECCIGSKEWIRRHVESTI
jgi:tetratricopeptide (TPR) repeat protein